MSARRPIPRHSLPRRTFLRGAGLALALPTLEAMLDPHGEALANGAPLPRRFVVWFWGNGNDPARWTPTGTGLAWIPSPSLAPLTELKAQVSVVTGMRLPTRAINNPHAEGVVGIMGGTNPALHPSFNGAGGDWNYMSFEGPSLDQVIANRIGGQTAFRSLEVGATPPHGSAGPGNAISYISHNGPYNPNRYAEDPKQVFDRLFGPEFRPAQAQPDPMLAVRASLLDAVKQDAASFKLRLGSEDRRRVDDHLEGIRVLEQRVRAIGNAPPAAGTCSRPAAPAPMTMLVGDRARARVMADLVAMAFTCDLTRVATFEYSSAASHVRFEAIAEPLLCNGTRNSFHTYEHCVGFDPIVRRVLTSFIAQYAEFLRTLNAVREGAGTLLDQSCVFGTSDVANGWLHQHENFPLLIAGKAGGALRPGQHIAIEGDAAARNAARVPLTLLRAFGVTTPWGKDQFVAREPIAPLLA